MADAIAQIERLERDPIPYTEQRPRRDLSGLAYGVALLGLLLLVAGKLAEVDLRRKAVAVAPAASGSVPSRLAA